MSLSTEQERETFPDEWAAREVAGIKRTVAHHIFCERNARLGREHEKTQAAWMVYIHGQNESLAAMSPSVKRSLAAQKAAGRPITPEQHETIMEKATGLLRWGDDIDRFVETGSLEERVRAQGGGGSPSGFEWWHDSKFVRVSLPGETTWHRLSWAEIRKELAKVNEPQMELFA